MKFILIEILFAYNRTVVTVPVINNDGLFCMVNCLDKSKEVIAYKLIDGYPVDHKYFGWGPFNKLVLTFTTEMFD